MPTLPINLTHFRALRVLAAVACMMLTGVSQTFAADGAPKAEASCCEASGRTGLLAKAEKKDPVLVVGSSIMQMWTHIAADLAPTPILNHGVSGSRTSEWLPGAPQGHWETKVLNLKPAALIYYCGSNDINASRPLEETFKNTIDFITRFWNACPDVPVLYLSVIRAPQKKSDGFADEVDALNAIIRKWAEGEPRVRFLDVNPALVDAAGNPLDAGYFVADQLHLTDLGYRKMSELVRPALREIRTRAIR